MNHTEKLIRDIETLKESIQLIFIEFAEEVPSAKKQALKTQITLLQNELLQLLERLWDEDDK